MYFSLSCGFLISGIALFIAYIIGVFYSNSLLDKLNRNHFRNSFAYNFYSTFSVRNRIVLYTLLGLSTLFSVLGTLFFFFSFSTSFMIVVGVIFAISFFLMAVSNVVSLDHYKIHLSCSIISMVMFSLMAAFFSFSNIIPGAVSPLYPLSNGVAIPIGILGFLSIIFLCNPKLSSWFKMEKTEEDGKTYYVKPKVNFLALYEWLALFFYSICEFCFILNIVFYQFA